MQCPVDSKRVGGFRGRKRRTTMIAVGYFKGTLAPSGVPRQVPARRFFGNTYTRLGIRVRDLHPRSVLRSCRIVEATLQEY